ncbi:MAG: SH3 domain-containing protein [Bdellovibrionota bacterium]
MAARNILLLLFLCMPFSVFAVCVTSSSANLRSGPGTNYRISWKVQKYMPFDVIKSSRGWYRVKDLDGDIHWIHKQLVTSRYYCAVIKSTTANMRTGPGGHYPKSPLYPVANHYDSFRLLKQKGSWAYVEDPDGDKYWVHRSLIWVH